MLLRFAGFILFIATIMLTWYGLWRLALFAYQSTFGG